MKRNPIRKISNLTRDRGRGGGREGEEGKPRVVRASSTGSGVSAVDVEGVIQPRNLEATNMRRSRRIPKINLGDLYD
jgi:hypothetical protein